MTREKTRIALAARDWVIYEEESTWPAAGDTEHRQSSHSQKTGVG